MQEKLISVIIPIYNTEEYLSDCLNSILLNTYSNLEIICVNDGSTDNSLNILKEFAEKDSRIKIIDMSNSGVSVARNTGLDAAIGDLIAFIDSDDFIHKRYFEIIASTYDSANADMVACRFKKISSQTESIDFEINTPKINLLNLDEAVSDALIKQRIWGRIYSRELISDYRFPKNMALGEDTVFNLEVICNKPDVKIAVVEEEMYFYLYRESSAVNSMSHGAIIKAGEYYLEHITDLPNSNSKKIFLFEAFKAAFAYRYLEMFNPDKNTVRERSKKIIKKCISVMKELNNISFKERLKYRMLSTFPILYRAFRIINDRTMLNWERETRKNIKIKKG